MAPKRSCKGKKRSKKCSRKRSCPKKPSLFMDDIRWMQFKKAAQEAIAAGTKAYLDRTIYGYDDAFNPFNPLEVYLTKIEAQTAAWGNFYKHVNPQFVTEKLIMDTENELNLIVFKTFNYINSQKDIDVKAMVRVDSTTKINGLFPIIPFKVDSIINALRGIQKHKAIV